MANRAAIIESDLSLEEKVVSLMKCIAQELKIREERKISGLNVSGSQLKLLEALDGSPGGVLTVGQLKAKMPDDYPNVTRALNKLKTADLITKQRSTKDERVVNVTVTVFGRQICRTARDALAGLSTGLSDAELKQLYELLQKI